MTDSMKKTDPIYENCRRKVEAAKKKETIETFAVSKQMAGDRIKVLPIEEKDETVETDKLPKNTNNSEIETKYTAIEEKRSEHVLVVEEKAFEESVTTRDKDTEPSIKNSSKFKDVGETTVLCMSMANFPNEKVAVEVASIKEHDTEPSDASSTAETSLPSIEKVSVSATKDNNTEPCQMFSKRLGSNCTAGFPVSDLSKESSSSNVQTLTAPSDLSKESSSSNVQTLTAPSDWGKQSSSSNIHTLTAVTLAAISDWGKESSGSKAHTLAAASDLGKESSTSNVETPAAATDWDKESSSSNVQILVAASDLDKESSSSNVQTPPAAPDWGKQSSSSNIQSPAAVSDWGKESSSSNVQTLGAISDLSKESSSSNVQIPAATSDWGKENSSSNIQTPAATSELSKESSSSNVQSLATISDWGKGSSSSDIQTLVAATDWRESSNIQTPSIASDRGKESFSTDIQTIAAISDLSKESSSSNVQTLAAISDWGTESSSSNMQTPVAASDWDKENSSPNIQTQTVISDWGTDSSSYNIQTPAVASDLSKESSTSNVHTVATISDWGKGSSSSNIRTPAIVSDWGKESSSSNVQTLAAISDLSKESSSSNVETLAAISDLGKESSSSNVQTIAAISDWGKGSSNSDIRTPAIVSDWGEESSSSSVQTLAVMSDLSKENSSSNVQTLVAISDLSKGSSSSNVQTLAVTSDWDKESSSSSDQTLSVVSDWDDESSSCYVLTKAAITNWDGSSNLKEIVEATSAVTPMANITIEALVSSKGEEAVLKKAREEVKVSVTDKAMKEESSTSNIKKGASVSSSREETVLENVRERAKLCGSVSSAETQLENVREIAKPSGSVSWGETQLENVREIAKPSGTAGMMTACSVSSRGKAQDVKEPEGGLGSDTVIVVEIEQPVVLTKLQEDFIEDVAPELCVAIVQFDPDELESKSCCSCCQNCCFQTCSCNLSGIFTRNTQQRKGPELHKEELFTPTLQKASVMGGSLIKKAIFPLVIAVAREVWVSLELATVLLGLILSIITVSFDDNQVFNILHLVLIILSSALAIVDATYSLLRCQSCRLCYSHITKGIDQEEKSEDGENNGGNKCLRCLYWCNRKLDVARLIVTEVLVYPLLVCDIFEIVVGRSFESDDHTNRLGFALFLLSCISLLLYVYIVRVIILGRSIRRLHKYRTLDDKGNKMTVNKDDLSNLSGALKYQISFFIHILMQMLAQIMMLIAIGAKIRYDNRHFYEPGNTDDTIYYSTPLIIMLVIAYISPTFGYLSFFIVTKPWAQEFPLGVFNTFLSQLKLCQAGGPENFLADGDDMNEEDEEKLNKNFAGKSFQKLSKREKVERIKQFGFKFTDDFKKWRDISFLTKFEYPFKNPWMVILCLFYASIQLIFIICAGVAVSDTGVAMSQVLNGGGWVVYYIIAIIFGAIANAYAFLVAGFWISVFLLVVAIMVGIMLCIVLVILLAVIAGSSSSSNRRQY